MDGLPGAFAAELLVAYSRYLLVNSFQHCLVIYSNFDYCKNDDFQMKILILF